ncbi:hypothetical protein SUGI_0641160 [Cryptomeria japonica]|uniref:scopoletin glucosyltransferase-like n=1 Tax=Cryptomeria japonica TaxID=3369 RepID=UPI00241480EF|nr:scopoletin glucosyltransferase-like [Cryptomeria japonica]GLJ31864.1 hypothetical protein SUGI_0641160 [Cryptomeria japonica]
MGFSRPHVILFPFLAQGHMIPLLDIAKVLAGCGLRVSYVTTHGNACHVRTSINEGRALSLDIHLVELEMPWVERLPQGCENMDSIPSLEIFILFLMTLKKLQEPFEKMLYQLIDEQQPACCLIADLFFGWCNETAEKFQIPRLVFHGISSFALSVEYSLWSHLPHKSLKSEQETFLVPEMPTPLVLSKANLSKEADESHPLFLFFDDLLKRDKESWGIVANTFYELEPVYVDHLRKYVGKPVWTIGPLSLSKGIESIDRGKSSDIKADKCLQYLDSQRPRSVLYISFGSQPCISDKQISEIALALQAIEQPFIWIIKLPSDATKTNPQHKVSPLFPSGFEEITKKKGLIIMGWAPQLLILSHPSIGGFLTHCGWNSTIESISSGVPMIAWPFFAEQNLNVKMVVDVLRIGLPIPLCDHEGLVRWEGIKNAALELMHGEEGQAARGRVLELAEAAKKAVGIGGSSHKSLVSLVEQIHKWHTSMEQYMENDTQH